MSLSSSRSKKIEILDSDGEMTPQLECALTHIFAKYCYPPPTPPKDWKTLLVPPPYAWLTKAGLDEFAIETNGETFSDETKDEIKESFDVTDDFCLTLKGFLQMYELQTSNDEEETWKDLEKHGFNRNLQLTSRAYTLS